MGHNTVIVELNFFGVKEISINSLSNRYKGNIEITKDETGLINVDVTGNIEVKLKATVGNVASVRGYFNLPE